MCILGYNIYLPFLNKHFLKHVENSQKSESYFENSI